jgi:hypothetical protein
MNIRRTVFANVRQPHVRPAGAQTNGMVQSCVRIETDLNWRNSSFSAEMAKSVCKYLVQIRTH